MKQNSYSTTARRIVCGMILGIVSFAALPLCAADGILTDDAWTSTYAPWKRLNGGETHILRLSDVSTVFLKWDLSSLPGYYGGNNSTQTDNGIPIGFTIVKASLRLYIRDVLRPGSFDILIPNADWNEGGINATNQPGINSGYRCCITIDESDENTEKVIDLTELVLSWYTGYMPNYGIMLIGNSYSEKEAGIAPAATSSPSPSPTKPKGISVYLSSKESPTFCYPARLEVTFGQNYND
jgi:hypothetical protein